MSDETIIKKWRTGATIKTIAKEYRRLHNINIKKDGKKITEKEALEYVYPIIFKYQTNLMKGEN